MVTGAATGTAGISKINQVYGSGNGDILVGNGTGILLQETAGNNLLIGGTGQAAINSGSGQDIVIAGSTNYDSSAAALRAIETYWANTSIAQSTRYSQLSGAEITGGYKLTAATVKHAAASDTLVLGSAYD